MRSIVAQKASALTNLTLFIKMKRASDNFVSVNPNSPRKQRRKRPASHGSVVHFGNTSATPIASDSLGHTPDENQPNATLGSPWTPLPNFRAWDSAKRTGSDRSDLPTPSITVTPARSDGFSRVELESSQSPILLKLRNTANTLGQTLEGSHMHVYDTPSRTPRNAWKDCKREVLKMISDASRSPLDLILDILDPSQDEHEQYRSRWFSQARRGKLSELLDSIFAHPKGRELIMQWMHPHALEFVCSTVASEMDLVSKELSLPSVEHVSLDFISNWSLKSVIEPATRLCPSLMCVLEAAAQTGEAKRKNKIKLPKTVRRCSCSSYTSTEMWLGL
jgi:hypothetical protein